MDSIYVFCWCVVGLVTMLTYPSTCDFDTEPTCLSRFDYDHKMLQKLLSLEQTIQNLKDSLVESKHKIEELSKEVLDSGSVYIRWGRKECQDNAEVIYKGFTAGKKFDAKGSGSDTICLPEDPSWLNYSTSNNPRGIVYGTEINIKEPSGVFENKVNDQDLPCIACHIKKSSVIMVPGRSHCHTGWTLEYAGYLMTAYKDHHGPHNHVCIDHHPDFVHGGKGDHDEHILYLTISKCGSLPCPPYANDRELACVVCSK